MQRRTAFWLSAALALAGLALLVAINSGDALGQGLQALVHDSASNIGDPWPTVVAATALRDDARASLYAGFTPVGSSFIYPPLVAFLFAPFAHASYDEAHGMLATLSRASYVVCVLLVGALAASRGRVWLGALFAAACAVAFYPLLRSVQLNQATLQVSVLVGVSLLAARRGRVALAGVCIGAAAAFKPQIALVMLLALPAAPRFAGAGLLAGAVAALASVAAAGVANHVAYVRDVLPKLAAGYAYFPNQSLVALLLRLGGEPYVDFALPHPSPGLKAACTLASLAGLALGAVLLLRAARVARGRIEYVIAAAWLVVTVSSPVGWEHHYTPAMFVFALLAADADRGDLAPRGLALAAAAFPLVGGYIEVRSWPGLAGQLFSSYVLAGALLLFGAVLVRLRART